MTVNSLNFAAVKLTQPIGELFVASIPSELLSKLAKSDIRRITSRELEKRSGIQRGLNKTRVSEISNYIETVDASFPNAIILNLNSEYLNSPPQIININCGNNGIIFCFDVAVDEHTFSIIDGQHRLKGFESATVSAFDLIVSFFIDLPIEDQAYLFSTINVTQAKVSKSLVYDLFDVSETRSPQRTAHIITKALNSDEDSPLFRRIKLLGIAPRFEDEVLYRAPLSQGTVAGRIIDLISKDPMRDRDTYRRGESISLAEDEADNQLVLRRFFVEDKDWAILKILKNYFLAVSKAFPDLWEQPGNPLSKTIGYGALMRLFVDIFVEGRNKNDLSFDFFFSVFKRIAENSALDEETLLNFENFPAAGSGETKLYNKLKSWAEIE